MEHKEGKGKDSFLDDYKGKTRNQEVGLTLKTDDRLSDVVTDMGSNPTQAESEIKGMVDNAVKVNGITDNDVKVVIYNNPNDIDESGKLRMGGHKEGTIYINAAHQDGSKEKLAEVLTDEMSHYVDYKKGRKNSHEDPRRQEISTEYGNNGAEQTRRYVGEEKVTDADRRVFKESLQQHDFSKVNQEVAETEGMENRVYSAARDLNEFPIGTHQFEVLIPDNPQDFDEKKLKELGVEPMRDLGNGEKGWVIGGHSRKGVDGKNYLQAEFFEKADTEATKEFLDPKIVKWYKSDFDTEAGLVKHEGKTDTEYITDLLKNIKNYQGNQSSMPIPYPKNTDQYDKRTWNSNSWNNSNLKHAGGTEYQTDFKGMDAARDNVIPKKYFNNRMSFKSDEKSNN